jgi:Protein of unknown function (DUF1194)
MCAGAKRVCWQPEDEMRLWLVLLFLAAPVQAECRLALALAVDVSRSVDAADFVIQTEGLAAALADPEVQRAFLKGGGEVALAIYQWSGARHQEILQDWTVIAGPEALDRVIWAVRVAKRPEVLQATALGEAMRFGATLLDRAPPCDRRVLDMAGDGQNNSGVSVSSVRDQLDFTWLTINGLAIGEHELGLVPYYQRHVIGGPGAFVEVAPRQTDYPPAIRRKLLRELESLQIGLESAKDAPGG